MRGEGREETGGQGREGGEMRRDGREGLFGNVAEEAFCLKSAPVAYNGNCNWIRGTTTFSKLYRFYNVGSCGKWIEFALMML